MRPALPLDSVGEGRGGDFGPRPPWEGSCGRARGESPGLTVQGSRSASRLPSPTSVRTSGQATFIRRLEDLVEVTLGCPCSSWGIHDRAASSLCLEPSARGHL